MKKIILSVALIISVSSFAQTKITTPGYEGTIETVDGDKIKITDGPGDSFKDKVVNIEINGKTKLWINTTTETIENYKAIEKEKDLLFGDGFVKFIEEGDNYFISELKEAGTGKTIYWLKYIVVGKTKCYLIQPLYVKAGYASLDEVKHILKYAKTYKPTN